MKKKKTDSIQNNKKSVLVNPKYRLPITTVKEITQKHIEDICELIEKGNFIETACTIVGVEPESFFILMKHRAGNELSKYAEFSTKTAQANAESAFIKKMLDENNSNNANIKAVGEFLQIVNPKFHKKYRVQMEYELAIVLDIIRANVSREDYLKILDAMRSLDSKEVVASLDARLRTE